MEKYTNIIIGSGQAGNPLASYLAQKGEASLLIEKSSLGGSCVNVGCTPSKTLYEAVRKIHHAREAEYAGFKIDRSEIDFKKLMNFVRQVRNDSNKSLREKLEKTDNLSIIYGFARFTAPRQLVIETEEGPRQVSANRIFINTGSEPVLPPVEGLKEVPYLTNQNIFELDDQPESLVILGGGYIGLEFAQNFARLGTRVQVVDRSPQIMSSEDEDLTTILRKQLEKEGVRFHTGTEVTAAEVTGVGIRVKLKNGQSLSGEKLLVAAGRRVNSSDLGLENTAIQTDERGHIKTNDQMQTNEKDVFAMGEVAGSAYFTHISYDDYRIVKACLEGEGHHKPQERTVAFCMFTDPQLAGFGLNEQQAQEKNIDYHLYSMPMSGVSRAREMNETTGKIKVLCENKAGRILGARILGVEAGEMMSVLQVAAEKGMTADELHKFVFAHPVLAEGFNNLFS